MRVIAMAAGVALLVGACGGKKDAGTGDSGKTMAPTTPAAATGANHEVDMSMINATSYKFAPDTMTIHVGDQVTFKGVSGGAHDVAFNPDSIPAGAKDFLNNAIQDRPQDDATKMINDGESVSISFAGAPVGTYHYYCIPHQAMGMSGVINVVQ